MSTHEHVCGACGRPDTPRVWRSGDAEPGADVGAVLDANGWLWNRSHRPHCWAQECTINSDYPVDRATWTETLEHGPLVEVMLPEPVLS
jgi:hypothetical protein